MGRRSGWIAAHAGLAGGADLIIVPERPCLEPEMVEKIKRAKEKGQSSFLVVVAEGAFFKRSEDAQPELVLANQTPDAFGRPRLGGAGHHVAQLIEARVGLESRVTVLGHVQRGGAPTSRDRVLALRLGVVAQDLIDEQKFGEMVSLQATRITSVTLKDATAERKALPSEWLDTVERFTLN